MKKRINRYELMNAYQLSRVVHLVPNILQVRADYAFQLEERKRQAYMDIKIIEETQKEYARHVKHLLQLKRIGK